MTVWTESIKTDQSVTLAKICRFTTVYCEPLVKMVTEGWPLIIIYRNSIRNSLNKLLFRIWWRYGVSILKDTILKWEHSVNILDTILQGFNNNLIVPIIFSLFTKYRSETTRHYTYQNGFVLV